MARLPRDRPRSRRRTPRLRGVGLARPGSPQPLHHRRLAAGYLAPSDVKRDAEQGRPLRVEQMTGGHIAGVPASAPHNGPVAGSDRLHDDLGRVPSAGTRRGRGGEQDRLATRQHLGAGSAFRRRVGRDRRRLTAIGGHLHDALGPDPGEHVLVVPGEIHVQRGCVREHARYGREGLGSPR